MAFRVLPRALRPTRVWRLAEPLLEGMKDPEFEVLLRRIDASPIHPGNDVTVFFEGPPAFASMCASTIRFFPTSGTSPTAITARSSSRTAASRSRAA
jgi:hypothetical protein